MGGMGAGPGPGQSSQLIQQVQALLAQIMQNEPEPAIQRAVNAMLQMTDDLSKVLGQNDQQDMQSGLNTPGGAMAPGGPPPGGGVGGPDLSGGTISSEGPATPPTTFKGANKAALANFKSKGNFSKSGSKGEELQTEKTKNRLKGAKGR
jgi:hypothetical protein